MKGEDKSTKQWTHIISEKNELSVKPMVIMLTVIPLLVWAGVVYHFWWKETSTRWKFGKFIIFPILFPFIYGFINLTLDLKEIIPFPPDFKLCFHGFHGNAIKSSTRGISQKHKKHLEKLGFIGTWSEKCESVMLPLLLGYIGALNVRADTVANGILLLGLVSTAFRRKNIFAVRIIRNFMALCLAFTIFIGAFSWFNNFWIKTLLILKFLSVVESMNIASFLIVILGFVYETVF